LQQWLANLILCWHAEDFISIGPADVYHLKTILSILFIA